MLTSAGFFPDGHPNVEKLRRFITARYNPSNRRADSLSTLSGLSKFVKWNIDRAELVSELSPGLLIMGLERAIPPDKLDNDFFRTCYVVLFTSYVYEFDKLAKARRAAANK
jgi:hypothetical protein